MVAHRGRDAPRRRLSRLPSASIAWRRRRGTRCSCATRSSWRHSATCSPPRPGARRRSRGKRDPASHHSDPALRSMALALAARTAGASRRGAPYRRPADRHRDPGPPACGRCSARRRAATETGHRSGSACAPFAAGFASREGRRSRHRHQPDPPRPAGRAIVGCGNGGIG